MSNYTLHGALADYVVESAELDKLGFLKVEIHVDREMPVVFSNLHLTRAPDVVGVPCVGSRWLGNRSGFYTIAYKYDGQTEPESYSFDLTPVVCALKGSNSEEPIETNPYFLALIKKYGTMGYNDDGSFKGFPALAPASLGLAKGAQNPVYGTLDYLNIGWVWSRTYGAPTIPPSVYENAGCIDTPKGAGVQQPPPVTNLRNYIKLAPDCDYRGNAWQIEERWRAGGRRPINPDVYRTVR